MDPNGSRLALADVVRLLREDIGQSADRNAEDLRDMEDRMNTRFDKADAGFLSYQSGHLDLHGRRKEDTDQVHAELAKRLDAMTIVEARRAGSLAVILLIVRTLGQNWQAIAAITALVGVLLGRIDIAIQPPLP